MFVQTLPPFLAFLRTEYFPKVTQFKFESSVYTFESPLNFLMLRSDFKEFLESFHQAEALLHYALQFQIASLFTLKVEEDQIDHSRKKQEASKLMISSYFS